MDFSTTILFAVAALLGLNHLVFRIPGWERRRVMFWLVQLLNLSGAIGVLIWGLPGFDASAATAIKWVLGLLLILHIITNNQRLVQALSDTAAPRQDDARRRQIKAALARGEE